MYKSIISKKIEPYLDCLILDLIEPYLDCLILDLTATMAELGEGHESYDGLVAALQDASIIQGKLGLD